MSVHWLWSHTASYKVNQLRPHMRSYSLAAEVLEELQYIESVQLYLLLGSIVDVSPPTEHHDIAAEVCLKEKLIHQIPQTVVSKKSSCNIQLCVRIVDVQFHRNEVLGLCDGADDIGGARLCSDDGAAHLLVCRCGE